jgi:hypothetical protein
MNEFLPIVSCFVVVVCGLILFALYNIYRGVNDTLANSRIGSVYNFRYFQPMSGDYERFLAKVTKIRKLTKDEISRLNWYSNYREGDKDFQRSPTLVTCLMGDGSFRQFYAERSDMCRRTAVGNLLFKAGYAHLF